MRETGRRQGRRRLLLVLACCCSWAAATPRRTSPPATRCRAAPPSPASTSAAAAPSAGRARRSSAGLADRVDRPDPGHRRRRDRERSRPSDAGLAVDYAASVAAGRRRAAAGRPARLWDYFDRRRRARPRRRPSTRPRWTPRSTSWPTRPAPPPTRRRRRLRGRPGRGHRPAPGKGFDPEEPARRSSTPYLSRTTTTAELELDRGPARHRRRRRAGGARRRSPTRRCPAPVTLVFGDSPVQLAPARLRAGRWR